MTQPVRVALVALLAAGRSGVPRYTAALVRALDGVSDQFDALELRVVTTAAGASALGPLRVEVELVGQALSSPTEGLRRVVAEQLAARRTSADLLHFFDLTGPLLAPTRRFVTTLHDASGARGRDTLRFGYKRFVQPWALRHARAVVAVSAFSRDEAVAYFGADPGRMTVIHSGPGLPPTEGATSSGGAPSGDFLLYIGDLSAHKNLVFLVDVFERAGTPERLVLAGRPGDGYSELASRIEASPAGDRILTLFSPSDEQIDGLYRDAIATVLPSRYEGFGFTPLEAMARGCPVVASDIPALRETAGDGALLLPLDAEAEWVEAVQEVTGSEDLRARMRARGNEVVSKYSWEQTARGLCKLFLKVAQ